MPPADSSDFESSVSLVREHHLRVVCSTYSGHAANKIKPGGRGWDADKGISFLWDLFKSLF